MSTPEVTNTEPHVAMTLPLRMRRGKRCIFASLFADVLTVCAVRVCGLLFPDVELFVRYFAGREPIPHKAVSLSFLSDLALHINKRGKHFFLLSYRENYVWALLPLNEGGASLMPNLFYLSGGAQVRGVINEITSNQAPFPTQWKRCQRSY